MGGLSGQGRGRRGSDTATRIKSNSAVILKSPHERGADECKKCHLTVILKTPHERGADEQKRAMPSLTGSGKRES